LGAAGLDLFFVLRIRGSSDDAIATRLARGRSLGMKRDHLARDRARQSSAPSPPWRPFAAGAC